MRYSGTLRDAQVWTPERGMPQLDDELASTTRFVRTLVHVVERVCTHPRELIVGTVSGDPRATPQQVRDALTARWPAVWVTLIGSGVNTTPVSLLHACALQREVVWANIELHPAAELAAAAWVDGSGSPECGRRLGGRAVWLERAHTPSQAPHNPCRPALKLCTGAPKQAHVVRAGTWRIDLRASIVRR